MADNSVAGLQQRYGDRWRWLAVATVMAGTMSTVLSATVVNVALFTVISVLGGFAASPEQLIAARIGQGAMAGLMQPMAMFLVFRIFPRNQRGRAMGIYGMGVVLAPALGAFWLTN
nr:MFS transporter [Marinobacter gelidimuriae]